MLIKITEGTAVKYKGKYWGCVYEDGHSTSYDWTDDPTKVKIAESMYITKPSDMTYKGSFYTKELNKGTLTKIKIVTTLADYPNWTI